MVLRGGTYYVVKMLNGVRRKRSTGKRDFKSALRRYHEIMKDWNDGVSGWNEPSDVPTFESYYREHYRPAYTVRKSAPERDDQLAAFALQELGPKRLNVINKTMCQRLANRRRAQHYEIRNGAGEVVKSKPIAESTVTREISFLQAVFQQAVEDGFLDKNPWRGVEREAYATKEKVLSAEEQSKLEAVLTPRFRRWFLFMLGTGLRLDEARHIDEAQDVDFPRRFVRVVRKTRGLKKKVQEVPLIDDFLLDILQEQLTEDGQLWHQNQQRFREVLNSACERAGVEHISPHTLRHTFATRYLKGGGDIYVLSKILGHSSVSVTEKVYAHLLTDDLLVRSRGVYLGLKAKVVPFRQVSSA